MTIQLSLGLLAPAGTPKPVIEQIARAALTMEADPAYRQKLIESGFEPVTDSTPDKFRRSLEADVAFWRPVVSALSLKID